MAIRKSYLWLLALAVLVPPAARAGEITSVSHRARFFDSAAIGSDVYVVGYPGLVLKSSDRGKAFTSVDVPTKDALFSIDFNNAGLGAAVGRGGLVLVTTDSGKTWTKTNALGEAKEGEDRSHLFAVDVLNNGSIVAVGDFATIVQSTDQGKTWTKRDVVLAAPAEGEHDRDGLPVGEHENAGFEDEARLTGVAFADDSRGWVVGEFGMIIATEDGGNTWKRQPGPTDQLLFSVHAVSPTYVVASGSDGTILETRDGKAWKVIKTPTHNHLFGVWASSDLVLAVGEDGAVVRREGTKPFELVKTNVHTWLSSVALHDASSGLIAGGRGHLLRTENAGKSFTSVTGE